MFFRRERVRELTFDDRTAELVKQGFTKESSASGRVRLSRKGCAAIVANSASEPVIEQTGILVGNDIGILVDGGYQKFFQTSDGHKYPALAEHLKALHEFTEDLYEGLGLKSL